MGLRIKKEEFILIMVAVLNVIVFLCIAYYYWYTKSRVEMRVIELKAEFFKRLTNYNE